MAAMTSARLGGAGWGKAGKMPKKSVQGNSGRKGGIMWCISQCNVAWPCRFVLRATEPLGDTSPGGAWVREGESLLGPRLRLGTYLPEAPPRVNREPAGRFGIG